jgi:hypothetical protein
VSITVRPVTHTADVAVKRAFNKPILSPLFAAAGRLKRKAPTIIKEAKPTANI